MAIHSQTATLTTLRGPRVQLRHPAVTSQGSKLRWGRCQRDGERHPSQLSPLSEIISGSRRRLDVFPGPAEPRSGPATGARRFAFDSVPADGESGTKRIRPVAMCLSPMNGASTKAAVSFSLKSHLVSGFWQVLQKTLTSLSQNVTLDPAGTCSGQRRRDEGRSGSVSLARLAGDAVGLSPDISPAVDAGAQRDSRSRMQTERPRKGGCCGETC